MLIRSLKSSGRVMKVQSPADVTAFCHQVADETVAEIMNFVRSAKCDETEAAIGAGAIAQRKIDRITEGISEPAPVAEPSPIAPR